MPPYSRPWEQHPLRTDPEMRPRYRKGAAAVGKGTLSDMPEETPFPIEETGILRPFPIAPLIDSRRRAMPSRSRRPAWQARSGTSPFFVTAFLMLRPFAGVGTPRRGTSRG